MKQNEVKQNTQDDSIVLKTKNNIELRAPEVQITNSDSRYIPSKIRNEIRLRSGDQCEYVDPAIQRRCSCKTKLEFDHIIPFMLGGQNSYENLRQYCSNHNKLSAIKQYGSKHMNQFLKN